MKIQNFFLILFQSPKKDIFSEKRFEPPLLIFLNHFIAKRF